MVPINIKTLSGTHTVTISSLTGDAHLITGVIQSWKEITATLNADGIRVELTLNSTYQTKGSPCIFVVNRMDYTIS